MYALPLVAFAALKRFLLRKHTISGQVWKKSFLAIGGILVGIFIAELVARIFDLGKAEFQPTRLEFAQPPYIWGQEGFLRHRPNNAFTQVYDLAGDKRGYLGPDGRITYRINNLGFRGPDVVVQKKPGVRRVLCLGDSFTFGVGVREADTYTARLAKLLAENSPVETVNIAVAAWGTVEEVSVFKRECLSLEPDIVVLGFVMNDALSLVQQGAMSDAVTYQPRHILRVTEILENTIHSWRTHRFCVSTYRDSFQAPGWEGCKDAIREMVSLSREHEFRFVVVIFPVYLSTHESYLFADTHRLVRDACEQAGAEVLDLLEFYKGHEAATLWVHPGDLHPNELGHKIAAEAIAGLLRKEGDSASDQSSK